MLCILCMLSRLVCCRPSSLRGQPSVVHDGRGSAADLRTLRALRLPRQDKHGGPQQRLRDPQVRLLCVRCAFLCAIGLAVVVAVVVLWCCLASSMCAFWLADQKTPVFSF